MTNDSLRKGTAIVVITLWTISGATALITRDPVVFGIVTPVMMFVMGFLYGFKPQNDSGR